MEFVFVVPRDQIFRDHYPQGLVPFGSGLSWEGFVGAVREHGFFVEREYAERTPNLKQVIPYAITTRGQDVLLLRRLNTGGDSRLHDKLSIGVGGHINPPDLLPAGGENREKEEERVRGRGEPCPVEAGTRREIEEELEIRGTYELRPVGILNDDSNPVGAVHVGLVQVLTVNGDVEIREKDVLEGRLTSKEELRDLLAAGANLETWSSILIRHLESILPDHELALS